MNILQLFQRSYAHVTLTPEERALLKFFYLGITSCAATAGVAATQVVAAHTSGGQVNWGSVLTVGASTFGLAFVEAARKWVSSQADAPVGAALKALAAAKATVPTETKQAGL